MQKRRFALLLHAGYGERWPRRKNEKAKNNGAEMAVSKRETRKASK
jgi:hypothetical protein